MPGRIIDTYEQVPVTKEECETDARSFGFNHRYPQSLTDYL